MKKYLFLLCLFFWIDVELQAQSFNRFKFEEPWSFSLQGGPSQYFGDLYSFWTYAEGIQPDYNIAVSTRYTFQNHLKARADIFYYQISGQDHSADSKSGRQERNMNFRSRNLEASLVIEYYLRPVKTYNIDRAFVNPYVFAGIGATTNNPHADFRDQWIPLRPLQTENRKYPSTAVVFPMGFGLKYRVNIWMDLFMEGNYRFTFTDYLDDVSAYDVSGFYEELIADYGINGDGPHPDRLRLSVRQSKFVKEDGEPNIELIRSSNGAPRRGSGDPSVEPDARYDGYFTFNVGLEIFFTDNIWDNWIFRKKRNGYRFW
jgi:hypothetical protein